MKSCVGKEVQKAEVTEASPEPEQKKANPMPIVVLILLIGGGVAVYFLIFNSISKYPVVAATKWNAPE